MAVFGLRVLEGGGGGRYHSRRFSRISLPLATELRLSTLFLADSPRFVSGIFCFPLVLFFAIVGLPRRSNNDSNIYLQLLPPRMYLYEKSPLVRLSSRPERSQWKYIVEKNLTPGSAHGGLAEGCTVYSKSHACWA